MDSTTLAQLITAGSTLTGVVLTLLVNAFLERRRAQDTRHLEAERRQTQLQTWLRDERLRAYSEMSSAAEDVMQFIRNDLLPLFAPASPTLSAARRTEATVATEAEAVELTWQRLKKDFRKAHNHVLLLGSPAVRDASRTMWRTARDGVNDAFRDLKSAARSTGELQTSVVDVARQLGIAGTPFVDACRSDLHGDEPIGN